MSTTKEVKGGVEVQTTTGTRDGVPVIIQTRTTSVTIIENGVRRTEVRIVEVEQPLLPLLRAEIARREEAARRRFEDAIVSGRGIRLFNPTLY